MIGRATCLPACAPEASELVGRRLLSTKHGCKQFMFESFTKRKSLQMFYEEGNAFNTFGRPQGFTQ